MTDISNAPSVSTSDDLLAENAAEWLGAVVKRRSRRSFDRMRIAAGTLQHLGRLCESWRPHPNCRAVLVPAPTVDVFTGLIGSYGKISGSPHLLVFVGDTGSEFADQHVGYCGEAVILEATRLGLATCWVGGFFSAKRVARLICLERGERAYAVSPLGFAPAASSATERTMAGFAGAHKRKCVAELAPTLFDEWPQWAVAAVETARLAPSAVNRQPWRFRMDGGGLVVSKDSGFETPKVTKRLDIGIAMLHVELATISCGIGGSWTDLTGSDVARFDPVPKAAQ